MKPFAHLREESSKIGVEFLLTELDAALTFLDVAGTTDSPETRERNQGHAREAYDTARRMQTRVSMQPDEKKNFDEKLALLETRLQDLGSEPA
ncbi:MAG TPA: hypothetical protein VFA99_01480 [Acidobacteriaceae bacterium]|nr:hypothetical protein [Acidobacteriaceae bacterium]